MLVIALDPAQPLTWSGRRHDDDGPNAVTGTTAAQLFDTVFGALHDGEQVAVGVAGEPDDERAAGRLSITGLLGELGQWRPWTAVSTSLAGWRATRSILVWEFTGDSAPAAVEALFALVGVDAGDTGDAVDISTAAADRADVNPIAAVAISAGLTCDQAELARSMLRLEVA